MEIPFISLEGEEIRGIAMNLHLTLTFDWYDKTASGEKDVEYRLICPHWHRLIWNRRKQIKTVTFSQGMTKTKLKRAVWKIVHEGGEQAPQDQECPL